ncbi:hypothetical protein [uncultured Friedmanniella sp.]|uniref:hypothetical protein n=1 Tax=uncultured Friedmanniella sp. TaxID=335381 RepID=UPI0035CB4569
MSGQETETARLRRNLALTTFLLESAADEALALLKLSERCVCGAMGGVGPQPSQDFDEEPIEFVHDCGA